MGLIHIFIVLLIVGFVLYLINSYLPVARWLKSLINTLTIIIVIIWLLRVLVMITDNGVNL